APDLTWVQWPLLPDLTWSDGQPFTAVDVKFTYDFVQERQAATANTYSAIEEVLVIDAHTVKIQFRDTNPAWALPFVVVEGLIIPQHVFANTEADTAVHPVGTSRYQLVSGNTEEVHVLGSELVSTSKLIFEVNASDRAAYSLYFQRGEL